MSGTRAGTGQPIRFKCARCKLHRDEHGSAKSGKPYATGARLRQVKKGATGRMCREYVYEYHCGECHHTGWTRHPDITREGEKLAAKGGTNRERRLRAFGTHIDAMLSMGPRSKRP